MKVFHVTGNLETRRAKITVQTFPGPMSESEGTGLVSFQLLITYSCQMNLRRGQVEHRTFSLNQLVS